MNVDNYLFSYTSLNTYNTCPYRWKLIYIDKLPLAKKGYLSFGTTVHNTLKYLLMGPLLPTLESVVNIYRSKWISDGYRAKNEETEYFNVGIEILKEFYAYIENNKERARYVEYPITANISDFTLMGIIDRIDITENNKLEIIDYKTSRVPYTHMDAEDAEQLIIYQFLVENHFQQEVEKLTIFNLRNLDKITVPRANESKITSIKNKMEITVSGIKSDYFEPVENRFCNSCDFQSLCPLYNKEVVKDKELFVKGLKYVEIEQNIKKLETEKNTMGNELIEYAIKNGIRQIRIDNYIIKIMKNKKLYFTPDNIKKLQESDVKLNGVDEDKLIKKINDGSLNLFEIKRVLKKLNFKDEYTINITKHI